MTKYISVFSSEIQAMLDYRKTMGLCSYEPFIKSFDRFCSEYYPQNCILARNMVLDWLAKESEHRNDLCHNATAIRHFGRYLASVGNKAYILPNNFCKRKSTFVPYTFTDAELKSFFCAADALKNVRRTNLYDGVIAPVLFRLLYTCGLRPNEGRQLKRSHINFETGEILIEHNKQKKERIVVMSNDMLDLCKRYDLQRSIFAEDSDFFFPARCGKPYTTEQMDRLFTRCWKNANSGIAQSKLPPARPYDLRHRFATTVIQRWLDEGRDLYAMLPYMRAFMGHEEFSSTIYYIHLLPENLVKSPGVEWSELEKLIPEVAQ